MISIQPLDDEMIRRAFRLLGELLAFRDAPPLHLVVCGGAALRMTRLHHRTTKDVDVLALVDEKMGELTSPAPLPPPLLEAVEIVARELNLPADWLNNGPSSDEGGLFQMGLPSGLFGRLDTHEFHRTVKVSFVSRIDQIHFKLFAAIDQPASYHSADLLILKPSSEELQQALSWAMTHDVSEGFRICAKNFLVKIGYPDVANIV